MEVYSLYGSGIVTLALISYSIAILTEQIKRVVKKNVLFFLSLGVILDITATIFMILGSSSESFITFHGLLGYSSLTLMLIDAVLLWRFSMHNTIETRVPKRLHIYSRIAYTWWVLAFITGGLLVALR